jgi:capsular exopolysaccharide synthesis family protein
MANNNLITINDPKAPVTEAYRMCRTNLHYLNIDKEHKAIVITSANTLEGKTITATNLAITMAQAGKKVMLVDADMRKPRVHKTFELNNGVGLTNLVTKEEDFSKVVQACKWVENLSIITSGPIPPNPSEILQSKAMKTLIDNLKDAYDLILIDAPPVCSVTDATVLSTIVDGVILVIASKETTIDSARVALKSLEKVEATILGTILTKVKMSKKGYYEYYSYAYGDDKKKKRKKNKTKESPNTVEAAETTTGTNANKKNRNRKPPKASKVAN